MVIIKPLVKTDFLFFIALKISRDLFAFFAFFGLKTKRLKMVKNQSGVELERSDLT